MVQAHWAPNKRDDAVKIDDSIKKATALPPAQPQANQAKRAEQASSGAVSADSVHLSAQMQSLQSQMSAGGVFDANKVEQIKLAIASGHFQVNSEKVADELLKTVRELLQANKG